MKIITRNATAISTIEKACLLLKELNDANKYDCLRCIMQMDAEQRLPYLNAYVRAIDGMHKRQACAA